MNISIRDAIPKDMNAVWELIQELAVFENEPDAVVIDVDYLIKKGFKTNPSFKVFVAEVSNEIVGMVLFYSRFSTWKGETLHLEDLIVKKDKRNLGIGKALYTQFLKYANEKQVKRVEWVVLDWNTTAINFYKKSGATVFDNWQTVQMNAKQIKLFVEKRVNI